MKRSCLLLLIVLATSASFSQMVGELFTGTIKAGSTANSAIIAIKSSATFPGSFTNLQFTVQIPNTVTPQPIVSIKSNPLNTYVPTLSYLTDLADEDGFYNYLFAVAPTGSPAYSFTAGAEIDALEVQFSGAPGVTSDVRLAQLPDGGSTGQFNFYIEVSGNDNTNATAPFYGTGAVNGGAPYSTYSYVPLSNVLLPVVLTNFSVTKKDMDGILNWQVSNQDGNSAYFELERSFTGTDFKRIGQVSVNYSAGTTSSYSFNDVNVANLKPSGVVFYRMKMVDKDGKYTYSQVKSLRLTNKSFAVNLYPNPAKDFSTASIALEERARIILTLSDASGKTVQSLEFDGLKGPNQKRINLTGFAKGTYLLKIKTGSEVQTISLLKH